MFTPKIGEDEHIFFRWIGSTTNQLVLQREESLQIVVHLESQGWTICITSRNLCWRFFVWHWKGWQIENHVEKWVEIHPQGSVWRHCICWGWRFLLAFRGTKIIQSCIYRCNPKTQVDFLVGNMLVFWLVCSCVQCKSDMLFLMLWHLSDGMFGSPKESKNFRVPSCGRKILKNCPGSTSRSTGKAFSIAGMIRWMFPKIGGNTPKWMVKRMENPSKLGWFGGNTHYFRKHPYRCYDY